MSLPPQPATPRASRGPATTSSAPPQLSTNLKAPVRTSLGDIRGERGRSASANCESAAPPGQERDM
eukprot:1102677-Heterocapsa_arctica.AAC.1